MDIPAAQDSPKNILNALNNDSITEIIRKLTNVEDFLSAAETCRRFQACAKDTFKFMASNYFKCININMNLNLMGTLNGERVESFTTIFGNSVESIQLGATKKHHETLYNRLDDIQIIRLISKNCGKTLKHLQIYRIVKPLMNERDQFPALETLSFSKYIPTNFKLNSPLQCLTFNNLRVESSLSHFIRAFPELKQVKFNATDCLWDDTFNEFAILNPQLQRLEFSFCHNITSLVFEQIASNLANLEHLSCIYSQRMKSGHRRKIVSSLVKLRKLKSFVWGCDYDFSIESLINAFVKYNIPIEELTFLPLQAIDEIKSMQTLNTLKHLTISWHTSIGKVNRLLNTQAALETLTFELKYNDRSASQAIVNQLKMYIKGALGTGKNLKQITCRVHKVNIDVIVYKSILALIKDRASVLIEVSHNSTINIPADVLKGKWLKIIVRNKCTDNREPSSFNHSRRSDTAIAMRSPATRRE